MELHSFKSFTPVEAKLTVSLELYSVVLSRAKEMLETQFSKPTSYFDTEKKNVLGIANIIFANIVSQKDIEDITREVFSVEIEDATRLIEIDIKPGETTSIIGNII